MTPLVMLPGMMCDARLFGPQIEALSGTYPLMTLPIGGKDTMVELAREVLAVAPPRFALLGLSMGGIVAMEILRQAPARVDRLALLDTNPRAEADEKRAGRTPQMEAAARGGLARILRDEMKPNYLADGPRRGAILDLCMAMALDLGPDVFIHQSRALRDRVDQSEVLRAYKGRALVLCGREDRLCPIERHDYMHGLLSGSQLQIIENAGHLPTLEQPELTIAAIRRWMEA